jgi:hypothetical protein
MFFSWGLSLELISSVRDVLFSLVLASIKGDMLFILVGRRHGSDNLGVKIEPILAIF